MNDFLAYRFPNQAIETCSGSIVEIDNLNDVDGFVFSDFEARTFYQFQIKNNHVKTSNYHVYPYTPYVYTTREYILQAHSFLNGINQLQLDKAIFSRIKSVHFPIEKAFELFESLCETYPKACVYLVSSEYLGTWIGASPEILMESHNNYIFTMSLAGTKKTSQKDVAWGEKELNEQDLVTQFIQNQFEISDVQDIELVGPYDFEAGPVIHLRTDISGRLEPNKIGDLIQQLHPTPAVSGLPREQALQLIASVEAHDRFLYAGIIGFISPSQTKLYVNLRCAQLQKDKAYLYLGGGFTPASIPEFELDETENKSKTLLFCIDKVMRK
ncbi:MAG: chorismate-binding protein [Crocinitomicaceae bacterium]|nr:chorismate-binding protein [Crocinitomicaceae bacterium]